jgi:hypothetical protein
MKAKIKATGEIVKIADYAKITLDQCDSYGNPIEMKPEEIELIQEPTEEAHWQDIRERAAIAAMQGMLANPELIMNGSSICYRLSVEFVAVDYANKLVERLKKK